MALPVPNLDDRRFQDIVDEAKRMIPQLCPEWTNHNISDPGVALVELFAWMTDMTLYRLNQVPDRMYTQFLDLLDQRQYPARAATCELTFWLSTATDEDVVVPTGTEVAAGDGPDGVVFATTGELVISQPVLMAARTGRGEDGLVDVLSALRYDRDEVVCFPSEPMLAGDALHLGFDRSLAGQAIELSIATSHAAGVGIDPGRAPIVWEAWTGEHWVACTVHRDDTGGLNRDGGVLLMVPRRHEALRLAGDRHWWLRVRLVEPAEGQPTYRTSPRVSAIEVACLGGTVRAEHSELVERELLGRSSGRPGQSFVVASHPVLPRGRDEVVLVTADGSTTEWAEVEDFSRSGEHDRHVVWDGANGEIRFGPTIRQPDGALHQHGAVPANGAEITVGSYRHGGGRSGNVGRGTITSLRVSIPYVDAVENLVEARGGVDAETLKNLKDRGPMTVRTGQRAVTASDFERLALDATTQVARVRCLPAVRAHDPVRVLIVPNVSGSPDTHTIDDYRLPDDLFDTVSGHLDERRLLGTTVELTTPFYVGISVVCMVRASTGRVSTWVRQRVLDTLHRYLNPITGGPDGTGWRFGAPVTAAALAALVGDLDGVTAVDELTLFEVDLRNGIRLGDATEAIALDERSLALGSRHRVVVR